MNLYLVNQDDNNDYDTYDSAVICAENDVEARDVSIEKLHNGSYYSCWTNNLNKVYVKYLGVASSQIEKGIVLASFNAG